jgi:hypothetical protein
MEGTRMIPSIPTPPTKQPTVPHSPRSEHGEQAALFQWIETQIGQYPEFALIAAIPNGGYRPGKWKKIMQAEGQRPGLADVIWWLPKQSPIGNMTFAGLILENKTEIGKLSKVQKLWQHAAGWSPMRFANARAFDEMQQAILDYHAMPWPGWMNLLDLRDSCRQYWDEVLRTREAREERRRKKKARAW